MSSNDTPSAPAEGTAASPAPASTPAPSTFGSSRGSGLARGKRSTPSGPSASKPAAPGEYTPTAIEIVTAPREYQNPFAPANPEPAPAAPAPAAVQETETPTAAPAPAPAPAPSAPARAETAPAGELFPLESAAPAADSDEKAELKILPPEQQRVAPPQTWESDGFRREDRRPRSDRGDRGDRGERPRRDEGEIPSKFRYERPKDGSVPAHRAHAPAPAAAPQEKKSGGFFGWLKGLFGGSTTESTPAAREDGQRGEEGRGEFRGRRRRRGGRGGGGGGGGGGHYQGERREGGGEGFGSGEGQGGERREGDGFRRRRRGGRGRGPRSDGGGYRSESGGGDAGGPPAV